MKSCKLNQHTAFQHKEPTLHSSIQLTFGVAQETFETRADTNADRVRSLTQRRIILHKTQNREHTPSRHSHNTNRLTTSDTCKQAVAQGHVCIHAYETYANNKHPHAKWHDSPTRIHKTRIIQFRQTTQVPRPCSNTRAHEAWGHSRKRTMYD